MISIKWLLFIYVSLFAAYAFGYAVGKGGRDNEK